MRDVSPEAKASVDIKELVRYLVEFVKHPTQKISQLPDWNWMSLFVFHVFLSIVSGVLAGLLKFSGWAVAFGLFLMPIVSTVSVLMMSLFLYYYFQFFEGRTENFRRIFTLVVRSSIPFYLFQILSEYFSPISLVGFAFTTKPDESRYVFLRVVPIFGDLGEQVITSRPFGEDGRGAVP